MRRIFELRSHSPSVTYYIVRSLRDSVGSCPNLHHTISLFRFSHSLRSRAPATAICNPSPHSIGFRCLRRIFELRSRLSSRRSLSAVKVRKRAFTRFTAGRSSSHKIFARQIFCGSPEKHSLRSRSPAGAICTILFFLLSEEYSGTSCRFSKRRRLMRVNF